MMRQRKHYAARIVPVIDRSTRIFDGAARGATSANGDFNALESACSYWGGKVQTSDAEYEGVPHPYVWWSPAGTLHHQVSGVFHYMLGAIQNCQESVQATDSGESCHSHITNGGGRSKSTQQGELRSLSSDALTSPRLRTLNRSDPVSRPVDRTGRRPENYN